MMWDFDDRNMHPVEIFVNLSIELETYEEN